MQVSWCKL